MSDVFSLKKHKDHKKAEIIVDDLKNITHAMDLAIRALTFYAHYTQVMEAVSSLKNNKTLLEIELRKYSKLLEEKSDNEKQ